MKKAFLTISSALFLYALCPAQSVLVHTQDQMNGTSHTLNSHAGDEQFSSLETIYRYKRILPPSTLMPDDLPDEQKNPYYPRVKLLPSGEYVMFYQGGQVSSRVFRSFSRDLVHWYDKKVISSPKAVKINGVRDYERYCNMEAAVLKNGTLLGAQAFRAGDHYKSGEGCGIRVMRSHDDGRTWTRPNVVYDGPCWEPYILELPDGTVQIYFTDAHPATRNSGTSLIESRDGGVTFGPKQRICRQFKYYNDGIRIFSDQMPVFRVLNDGKTIFGLLEDRLEIGGPEDKSTYWLSTARNEGLQWKSLQEDEEGPKTKEINVLQSNSGYVVTLPSGEVVISTGYEGYHSIKIGDHTATRWNGRSWSTDWFQPFANKGCWGSIEATADKHHIISTMDSGSRGILFCLSYLNHRITAPQQSVVLDGVSHEWLSDEALFIGSDSPVETIFRACNDGKNLYLAVESTDSQAEGPSTVTLSLCNASGKIKKGSSASFTLGASGLVSSTLPDIKAVSRTGLTSDGRKGYVCEISVPLSSIASGVGSFIYFDAVVNGTFEGKAFADGFWNAGKKPQSWQKIAISADSPVQPFISSHTGEEQYSTLQRMPRYSAQIDSSFLLKGLPPTAYEQKFACYPRIKKMANGEYIMFYMGGRFGSRIWVTRSKDFREWTTPELLFTPYFVTEADGKRDVRRFVNPDAVVLPNGDILLVVSFRAEGHYHQGIDCGLMTRRSTDNGLSWSEPELITDVCNWEPYLLLLPDGRLQCYFTHATPALRNSGTSVMTSTDNGHSWSKPIRCSRQYKYQYRGENIYTDQMPSFRVLNDGRTIVGFLESRNETKVPLDYKDKDYYSSYCKMSMVYNDALDWKDLGENSEGPAKRYTNVGKGAGGYVVTFPSGEVVISRGLGSILGMKILNSYAELTPGSTWTDGWIAALPQKGYWGTMEVDSPQTLVVGMHSVESCGLQLGRFWLNHRVDALQGNFSSDAFFLGGNDGAEAYIRVCRTSDALVLRLEGDGGVKKVELRLRTLGSDKEHFKCIEGESGEISIPLSQLGNPEIGDYVCLYAVLCSNSGRVAFNGSKQTDILTWQRIRIK